MERQIKESSEPTRQDYSDQEIYENNEMYETTVNEEKERPNEQRNLFIIDSQIPTCSKYILDGVNSLFNCMTQVN